MSSRWILLVPAIVLLSFGTGRVALLDPDEGRYAAAAREMIVTGDPIVPRFNGEPRLNKPPLLYWAQAASFLLLGETEAAARLPSLLSAAALLALVAWWAGLRAGRADPAGAVAVLSTVPLYFACARLAITDMLLTLWVGAALLVWHEAVTTEDAAARRRLSMAAALAGGMAALSKGPVGAILPALVIGVTAAISRRPRLITPRGIVMSLTGILLVGGPWLAGLAGRIGWQAILDLVRREGFERVAWGLDHPRPFYYLLVAFWPTFFPWSLAAPFAVVAAWRSRMDADLVPSLLVSWLAVVVLFFTILADKNDAYLLPAAPTLALLVARHLPRRWALWGSGGMALALVAALIVAAGPLSRARSMKEVVVSSRLDDAGGPGDLTLISYRLYKPSLVFYSRRPVRWARSGGELQRLLAEVPEGEASAIVMTRRRLELMRPGRLAGFREIGGSGEYVVLLKESRPGPRSGAVPTSCSCCT